ncbi:MAG: KH domain-containing protein [Thermodesulfobacteriota bacterium]
MKELVSFIAASLVDDRDAVQVNELEREDTTVYELRVAKEDLGKVIGKQGRTARAIRALLTATAARDNRKARLEILD